MELFKISERTCGRIINSHLKEVIPNVQEEVLSQAEQTEGLVLGVDDFANRKGHNYNTGLHDLRNGTLLGVFKGRTLAQLRSNKRLKEIAARINPVAVTMDLARVYHTICDELFPNAIRIADRFHVNRFITDALQEVWNCHPILKQLTGSKRILSYGMKQAAKKHPMRNCWLSFKRQEP